jgi:hypothetical protein
MKFLGKPLLAIGIASALPTLVWTGGLLYWHFRIERAIRTLEQETVMSAPSSNHLIDVPAQATQTLGEAGCRALPYLINSVNPAKKLPFLMAASTQIVETLNRAPAHTKEDCDLRFERRKRFRIEIDDAPELRKEKCAGVKEWWREHGIEVHQGWRFWSSCCAGD